MQYIAHSKARFDAALAEISRLQKSSFPYDNIGEILNQLAAIFSNQRALLDKLSDKSTPMVARNTCSQSLTYLFRYTTHLGLVLRASNVRNAFELYPPLLRLARKLLGPGTKLLLSSEWHYSPLVYLPTNDLPDCVLLGLPAFESSNALIVPLAGHELGHNVWNQKRLATFFDANVRDEVLAAIRNKYWREFEALCPQATHANLTTNMFVRQAWLPCQSIATKQLEEVFCDMVGLRLFGESYLHAFCYLLAPGAPGERSVVYPEMTVRIRFLKEAALRLGLAVPADYADEFQVQLDITNPHTRLMVAIADTAVAEMANIAFEKACEIIDNSGVPIRSQEHVASIAADFRMVMPSEGAQVLSELVNAGWLLMNDPNLWHDVPHIMAERRTRVLNDLILKSCEVTEYTERINAA